MEQQSTRLRNAGFATFFFSGICSIRAGMVVSLLQERYGFAYGMTGSLLSLLSIGNLLAGPDRCAAGGVRRCHPDAVGRGHRVGKSRPCRWDGLQHRALRGAGAVHPAGGTPAGRIRAEGDKTELVRDRSYGKA